jgi:hypothetical protein
MTPLKHLLVVLHNFEVELIALAGHRSDVLCWPERSIGPVGLPPSLPSKHLGFRMRYRLSEISKECLPVPSSVLDDMGATIFIFVIHNNLMKRVSSLF